MMLSSDYASVDAVVETIIDDCKVDDCKVDDCKVDDGKVDDGKVDDGKVDDGKVDDCKVDDCKVDDGKVDYGKVDDGKVDDGKVDDGKVDDCKVDDCKVDDVKVDDAKVDNYNDVTMADNKSNELDIVDIHKAVDITNICESVDVVMDETKAIEALAQALDGPVMQLFEVADYEVHDGDLKTWFARGPFTSLKPDKMDEIALCFTRLAKIRRVQDAAIAEI